VLCDRLLDEVAHGDEGQEWEGPQPWPSVLRATWSHFRRPAPRRPGLCGIGAGASVETVQMALGHGSPTATHDAYVGLWPDQVDRTRTLVDYALLGAPQRAVQSN